MSRALSTDYILNLPATSYHPSVHPQLLHILSNTLSFSHRPKLGSSRSCTSSRNPSRRRDRAGSDVRAYCRRCINDNTSSPVVSGGIAFGDDSTPLGCSACLCVFGWKSNRRSILLYLDLACVPCTQDRTDLIASQTLIWRCLPPYLGRPPNTSCLRKPPTTYTTVRAGATPTNANVSSCDLSSLSIPVRAWSMSTWCQSVHAVQARLHTRLCFLYLHKQ